MKRLVITIAAGTHVDYGHITVPKMYSYARKVGADLTVITGPSFGELEVDDGREAGPAWWKLPMLGWFGRQIVYQQLLYVDADCFIPDAAEDIFEECDGSGFRICEDMMAERELPIWRSWVREKYPASNIPNDHRYVNTGVFVADRESALELSLLDENFALRQGRFSRWYEQDFLGMLLANATPPKILPGRFNKAVPYMGNTYEKTDWLHQCGVPNTDRLKIFEKMLASERKGITRI